MTTRSVLVVDDHIEMARLVADKLAESGWQCQVADNGKAALDMLPVMRPDLIITDLRMAEVDGFDVLDAARADDPELPVIVMTAFGAIDSAIEAMKRGAWHYVVKPIRLDELVLHATRAFDSRNLRRENVRLRLEGGNTLSALIGQSDAMRELHALIQRVALASSPVLIQGESGTGKELVARAIHNVGSRSERPFLAVNCAALPESLLESELFGHTRGAFTGAMTARTGLFLEATGGTIFLDEIGDMPLSLQAKLLRVVQQGEVRPVGAEHSQTIDVRIIAATHQELERRVADGQFRQDLFYRLNVVPLNVPALRQRLDDVPLLIEHFLSTTRARNPHSPVVRVAPEVITVLTRYPWPGNVRELENLIERLVVVGAAAEVDLGELSALAPSIVGGQDRFSLPRDHLLTLRELEEEYINWVLERCNGNKTRASEVLGIDPSTLHRRIRPRR